MATAWSRHPRLWRLALGVVLLACFAWLSGWRESVSWLHHLDHKVYDLRLTREPARLDERIVIVDIDEQSLAEQGRWPWPRSDIARLIERMGQARVIGFDVVFADRILDEQRPLALEQAIERHPVVLGYYFSSEREAHRTGVLPAPAFPRAILPASTRVTDWRGYGANLPSLGAAAKAQGFFNPIADADGVVRSLPLMAEFEGQLFESLTLATVRQYLGAHQMFLGDDELKLRAPDGKLARLPFSQGLSLLVPYRMGKGRSGGNFRYFSASQVLEGQVPAQVFADRIVLVGSSAPGLTDLRATPLHESFPGVEVHAHAIRGVLDQQLKVRTDFSHQLSLLLLLGLGSLMAVVLAWQGSLGVLLYGLLAALSAWTLTSLAYSNLDMVMPVSGTLSLIAAQCLGNLGLGYFTEGRRRTQIIELFGEYLSPDVVDRLAHDPSSTRKQLTQTREITVMFCDIRGFTKISETMDPQVLSEYLNEYLTGMTEVIHQHGGTVDKYIGDAVMAFWGAPLDDEDHATHAVQAALKMHQVAQALSARFISRGLPALLVGMGIHTGKARVGDMGSTLRRTYTAIGDTVNLASRLESLTKDFDTPIVLSEATRRAVREIGFTELGPVQIQGRSESVLIYSPTSAVISRLMPAREARPASLALVTR